MKRLGDFLKVVQRRGGGGNPDGERNPPDGDGRRSLSRGSMVGVGSRSRSGITRNHRMVIVIPRLRSRRRVLRTFLSRGLNRVSRERTRLDGVNSFAVVNSTTRKTALRSSWSGISTVQLTERRRGPRSMILSGGPSVGRVWVQRI